MAENIHMHYVRLSPAELKVSILSDVAISSNTAFAQECAENMGYATFAVLFGVLDAGFLIVRVAGLVVLSGSPALATILVIISMSPSVIFPVLTYPARLLKRKKRESGGEVDTEAGTVVDGTRN